jgi:hypothetical protein
VPIAVAITFGILLLPRRAIPEALPLPVADARELARTAANDHQLAESARRQPLAGAVRKLGSAMRAFHTLEARGSDLRELGAARREVDAALIDSQQAGDGELLELRAVELEGFLGEVRGFEATGVESAELMALAGTFVRSMVREGWCHDHVLVTREPALRAMFKQMWNTFLGLEKREGFAPQLDEQRALYALFLLRPHPSQPTRDAVAAARRGARDVAACEALAAGERAAVETWRSERIAQLSSIDPSYPAAFARGVSSFRHGNFAVAAGAFRSWLGDHPEGPLTLRAQNYLRAAVDAERVE